MNLSETEKKWVDFYDKMGEGQVPFHSKFYVIDDYISNITPQEGSASIQVVSPSQAQIEQAKMQLKRNIGQTRAKNAKKRKVSRSKKPTKKTSSKKKPKGAKKRVKAKTVKRRQSKKQTWCKRKY